MYILCYDLVGIDGSTRFPLPMGSNSACSLHLSEHISFLSGLLPKLLQLLDLEVTLFAYLAVLFLNANINQYSLHVASLILI